jgi:PAS domain S-box-containing protein
MYNTDIMGLFNRVEELSKNLESLIEKAELWQLLFDESPDAIALFNEGMRFFLVNKAFCELTNFTEEEITGQKLSIVLPSEFRRAHKQYERDFMKSPEKKVNRHGLAPKILTREGEALAVDIDLSFFNYDGRTYYTAFIRKLA